MKQAILLLLSLLLAAGARADTLQASERPAPQPPYLAPVPAWGHWTVALKYKASGDKPDAAAPADAKAPESVGPVSIDTVRTGTVQAVALGFASGAPQTFYQQDGWVVTAAAEGPQVAMPLPTRPPYPFYTAGFLFLDGVAIGPATFKEAAKYNGVPCFRYQDKEVEVWIAADTMLPVAVRNGDGTEADYQFFPAPTKPVALPPDLAAFLQKQLAAYQYTRSLH